MNKKTKFVIVGFGNMGRDWANVLGKRKDVEIAGVVDVLDESLENALKTLSLGNKSVGKNLREVILETKTDSIINTSSPLMHKSVVATSIKLGCHVLGEKPMALNIRDAQYLIELSTNKNKIYMINQNYRWNPMAQVLKKSIYSNIAGKIYAINIRYSQNFNFKDTFRYKIDHPFLLDMAIHHFDLVRSITNARFRKVYCIEYNAPGSKFKNGSSVAAIFIMDNGIVFNYQGSWSDIGEDTGFMGFWKMSGEKGTITWDGYNSPEVDFGKGVESLPKKLKYPLDLNINDKDIFFYELSATLNKFLYSIKNNIQPETWCGDNIYTLKMVLSAIKSSKKAMPINN